MKNDYMRLFVSFAKEHDICFRVGLISITAGMTRPTYYISIGFTTEKFGSKAAYEWLVKAWKEAEG